MNNELKSAFNLREKLDLSATTAFRALHRGEWQAFDASLDIYGEWFLIWAYQANSNSQKYVDELAEAAMNTFQLKGGVIKFPQKNPHEKGLISEQKTFTQTPPPWFLVKENGAQFEVTLTEKQHTGLFLDQRDNRKWVRQNSQGARVANLFCFTSSFSVSALLGDAKSVHSVDITKSVLSWSERNLVINNIENTETNKRCFFYCDDVREWLKRQVNKSQKDNSLKYDIIICDPPTFASGDKKHGRFDLEKEWEGLLDSCKKIAKPGAHLLFSTNFQKTNVAKLKRSLSSAFKEIKDLPPPIDFPKINNTSTFTHYFLCLL